MRSQKTRLSREDLKVIDHFETFKIDHDDDGRAALVRYEELSVADSDPLKGSVPVRAKIFFYWRPIDLESLRFASGGIAAQNPSIGLFADIKPAEIIAGDSFGVIVADLL